MLALAAVWLYNAGGVAKEIDHVLVDGRWRKIQNCRVYWSAQFFNTDHRLVVATLKLQSFNPGEWYHPSLGWMLASSRMRGYLRSLRAV